MTINKLVSINVYYTPKSFGGATVVAEEVNNILSEHFGIDILVITTHQDSDQLPYHQVRYHDKGVTIISINLPKEITYEESYRNENVADIIYDILSAFEPDLIHAHSIQKVGASFLRKAKLLSIPIIVTAHDCWWLCDRQFMINNHGKYCFQNKIDPYQCMHCVDVIDRAEKRLSYLRSISQNVDLFLFPSRFHMNIHLANNYYQDKCAVNKNGIKFPKKDYQRHQGETVTFGFVGGPGEIKGLNVLNAAFNLLPEYKNYVLKLVDGAQNAGLSWKNGLSKVKIPGRVIIEDAFTQSTMDEFYGSIDVLLFPSLWKESFGLTVREALMRDVWVISTDGGGTTEDLRPNLNSTVIPLSYDPSHLKKALKILLDEKKNWSEYLNPHKADIKSFFDQAEELINNYNSVLLPSPSGVPKV